MINRMTVSDLVALRGWAYEVYNSGKTFAKVDKNMLNDMLKTLVEIDEELFRRIKAGPQIFEKKFVDTDFENTLLSIRGGKEESKE